MVMLRKCSLMKGEWSCYINGQLNGGMDAQGGGQFNSHVTEVGSLTEREWSFYRGGQFH